jgi:hypothetical protein
VPHLNGLSKQAGDRRIPGGSRSVPTTIQSARIREVDDADAPLPRRYDGAFQPAGETLDPRGRSTRFRGTNGMTDTGDGRPP